MFDGFFEFRLSPWDIAAGTLLIEEAGGRVTDLDGGADVFKAGNIIAGPEGVHRELLAAIGAYVSEKSLAETMERGLADGWTPPNGNQPLAEVVEG